MAYRFTEKTSHRQQETAYVLYMILGSLFHRCTCSSGCLETSLRLYYQDMPEKKQVELEEKVIRSSERAVGHNAYALAELDCIVRITKRGDLYKLSFVTGFEGIEAYVDKDGSFVMGYVGEAEKRVA